MSKNFILSDTQLKAINSDKNIVVTACPGSGKTTIMVEKIRKEIPALKSFQGIIGITFTVKSSNELKERCSKDGFNLKSSFFGTIDHFCLSEIVYPFANRIFGSEVNEVECKKYADIDDSFKHYLPNLDDSGINLTTADYEKYYNEFIKHYQNGFVLLEAVGIIANHTVNNSLSCRRYIKARYSSLYVDEYQDSSEPQHQLFLTLLYLGLKATAVGDIQQSIYAWRGSSSKYILELIQLNENFEHHIVNVNYRCHPSIINYANRLFSSKCELLHTENIRVFRRCFDGTQLDLVVHLNDFIPKVAKHFGITSLSDIAVLVRTNRSLDYLTRHLKLPFRVYKDDILSSINSKYTRLYSDLLKYYFDSSVLISDILEFSNSRDSLTKSKLNLVRKKIIELRSTYVNDLILAIQEISFILIGEVSGEKDIEALYQILSNEEELKQYKPKISNELQVMTLHKSKGLEFEIVIHLDLCEWIFPLRRPSDDFNKPHYIDWDQDLNLHYVGITRAKKACILAYSSRRLNSSGYNKLGEPSSLLKLEGLSGLYLQ